MAPRALRTPDGAYVYRGDARVGAVGRSFDVVVVQTSTNQVSGTITFDSCGFYSMVSDVALTPDGNSLLVSTGGGFFGDQVLAIFNRQTNQVKKICFATSGPSGNRVAVAPGGGYAYVGQPASAGIALIDLPEGSLAQTIRVDSSPEVFAAGSVGTVLQLTDSKFDQVLSVDVSLMKLVASASVGRSPSGAATVATR